MEKKTNGWAIAGLVCSIIVGSITGLIFSIIGLIKVKKYNSGKGLSIAGIIISVLRILFIILMIWLFSAAVKTDEFKKSFCESVSKEACTKNDDGTYDCIFATCTFNNVEEKKEPKKEDPKEEPSLEGTEINILSDMTTVKPVYDEKLTDCYIKDEHLSGECANEELKDIKILDIARIEPPIGPSEVYVLTEDKDLYFIAYGQTNDGKPDVTKMLTDSEITDIGSVYAHHDYYTMKTLIVKKGNKEYSRKNDSNNMTLVPIETIDNFWDISTPGIGMPEKKIFDKVYITYQRKLLLENKKTVKDNETKKEIEIKQLLYHIVNEKEQLFIIDINNKLYVMDKQTEYISPSNEVTNITYKTDTQINNIIVITFKDGSKQTYEGTVVSKK